jgi:hypothetical protein
MSTYDGAPTQQPAGNAQVAVDEKSAGLYYTNWMGLYGHMSRADINGMDPEDVYDDLMGTIRDVVPTTTDEYVNAAKTYRDRLVVACNKTLRSKPLYAHTIGMDAHRILPNLEDVDGVRFIVAKIFTTDNGYAPSFDDMLVAADVWAREGAKIRAKRDANMLKDVPDGTAVVMTAADLRILREMGEFMAEMRRAQAVSLRQTQAVNRAHKQAFTALSTDNATLITGIKHLDRLIDVNMSLLLRLLSYTAGAASSAAIQSAKSHGWKVPSHPDGTKMGADEIGFENSSAPGGFSFKRLIGRLAPAAVAATVSRRQRIVEQSARTAAARGINLIDGKPLEALVDPVEVPALAPVIDAGARAVDDD